MAVHVHDLLDCFSISLWPIILYVSVYMREYIADYILIQNCMHQC